MKVDVEDIIENLNERGQWNRPDLSEIEFYYDGKRVLISEEEIVRWEFTGLNNVDFVANRDWLAE